MDTTANTPHYVEVDPWDEQVQLQGEKETLGFYLTGHPLNRHINELSNFTTCRIAELQPNDHKNVCIAGIIANIRMRQTKRGDRIAIFTLDDGTSQIEIVCFSEPFQKYRPLIVEDQLVILEGEIGIDDFSNSVRMLARDLFTLEQARSKHCKLLQIHVNNDKLPDPMQLQFILSRHLGGNCPVSLRYRQDNIQTDIVLGKKWLIKPTEELLTMIREQLVANEIEFIY